MALIGIKKIRNWKDITDRLKELPDFGIHGTSYRNLKKILESDEEVISLHYFGVSKKEKELDNEMFYKKLFVTFIQAVAASYARNKQEGENLWQPCLLLGIDVSKKGNNSHQIIRPDGFQFGTYYNEKTFPVGHDFLLSLGIKLEGLVIDKKEHSDARRKVKHYLKRNGLSNVMGEEMTVHQELATMFIRKATYSIEKTFQTSGE